MLEWNGFNKRDIILHATERDFRKGASINGKSYQGHGVME
jgi:hypothetical protein